MPGVGRLRGCGLVLVATAPLLPRTSCAAQQRPPSTLGAAGSDDALIRRNVPPRPVEAELPAKGTSGGAAEYWRPAQAAWEVSASAQLALVAAHASPRGAAGGRRAPTTPAPTAATTPKPPVAGSTTAPATSTPPPAASALTTAPPTTGPPKGAAGNATAGTLSDKVDGLSTEAKIALGFTGGILTLLTAGLVWSMWQGKAGPAGQGGATDPHPGASFRRDAGSTGTSHSTDSASNNKMDYKTRRAQKALEKAQAEGDDNHF